MRKICPPPPPRKRLIQSAKLMVALVISFSMGTARAQVIRPTGSVMQRIASSFSAAPSDDAVVNCDMVASRFIDQNEVEAIVYGRRSCTSCPSTLGESYLYVEDWSGFSGNPTAIIQLPGQAIEPDVALANYIDPVTGLQRIQAGVVWHDKVSGDDSFGIYEITGVGTGTLTLSSVGLNKQLNTSGTGWGSPHIDMLVDPSTKVSGVASVENYAIVYTQDVSHDLNIYYGDINNGASLGTSQSLASNAYTPDIACLTDYTTTPTDNHAVICYNVGGTGDLNLIEFSINIGTVVSSTTIAPGAGAFYPRIEAMNQYYSGQAKWQIATCENGGTNYQAVGYNDITFGPTQLSFPLFSSLDVKAPCVGAGMGPKTSGWAGIGADVGNVQYTAGFFPWSGTDIYARDIDATTGAIITAGTYQVDDNPPGVNFAWDVARNFAISSTTNLGLDLMTAWADGNDIVYKHSPTNFAPTMFRIAPRTQTILNAFSSVWPNPATNAIHFSADKGSSYTISDITGRIVTSGITAESNTVSVNDLSSGMYILRRSFRDNKAEMIKFTKR